jgi:hypothetical protein
MDNVIALLLFRFDESVAAFAVTLPAGGTVAATAAQPADTDAMPAVAAAPAAPAATAAGPRDRQNGAAVAAGPQQREFFLHPATVRRNDTSAAAIDEWTVLSFAILPAMFQTLYSWQSALLAMHLPASHA